MKYTKIKSNFVKQKLKETAFENRHYIDDLMFLEKSITEGVMGMGSNIKYFTSKSKYKEEYLAILKELKPELYKFEKARIKKDEKEQKMLEEEELEEEKEQERRERIAWQKMGGKI